MFSFVEYFLLYFQDHVITHKQTVSQIRRKLPQINQEFKGATFKGVSSSDNSRFDDIGQVNARVGDNMMESTPFLDSTCTLPV